MVAFCLSFSLFFSPLFTTYNNIDLYFTPSLFRLRPYVTPATYHKMKKKKGEEKGE